ncbi:MAG TPA: hypothetical protein VF690_02745, partial [Hymenobacter sp.]
MQATSAYLIMRRRLLGRLLREIGWLRLAILVPVLAAALGRLLEVAAPHPQGQWALPVGFALWLASAHRQRADLRFLAISAPGHWRWLAVEYTLVALPLAGVLLLFNAWGAAGLTLGLAPGVALLPPGREARSTLYRWRSVFRSEAFEWVSGLRRGGAWLWMALLAGAVWQHESPLGPVLALAGWLLVVASYYGVPEPLTMLALAARTPKQFLCRRLGLGLGYAALTAAPLLWLLAMGPVGAGGALGVGLVWLGLVALIILTKYAFYPNAVHIRITQGLVVSVALAMPGHPA